MEFTKKSCEEFVEVLASNAPFPAAAARRPWWAPSAPLWATWSAP